MDLKIKEILLYNALPYELDVRLFSFCQFIELRILGENENDFWNFRPV